MGGKHKKRLRAEKAKVQLKKKKLPKGQNITDTSFKVKKILTVEQLKKPDENEPVSNWNVTLKDLLTRLSHYNYTTRLNSLTGIKEILTKYSEIVLGPSLKPLISRLLERLTDEEHKIRVTAINLLSHLLGLLSLDLIIPFYDVLNVYLACAMTHRNTSIQKDSLKFVDVIVEHCPGALKHNLQMLMQNFLRIIKPSLYGSEKEVFSLSGPKQELEQTKTEMVARFYRFLAACYSSKNVKESFSRNCDKNVLDKQKISLRDSCTFYKTIPDLSEVFKNSASKEKVKKESDSADLKSVCSLVMPLLFDTWTEFCPVQKNFGVSECVLTEAVGELLCVLLKTMLLLHEKVTASQDQDLEYWFISNYSQAFKKSFTTNFPYFPSASRKRSRSGNSIEVLKEGVNTCMEQNLIICYLSYSFKLVHRKSDLETKMEEYISSALRMKTTDADILAKVVEAAINASNSKESSVLDMAVVAHGQTKNQGLQQSLSKVLTKVALEGDENLPQRTGSIRNWITCLPHLLCRSQISVHEIETILKLIIRPSEAEVLKEVESKAEEIAENLSNIKIEGLDTLQGQRMIVCILYRCNQEVLEKIIEKQILSRYPESLRNYTSGIFSQKLGRQLNII